MTNRKISFVEGEYYHIYNRGNSKQDIFLDKTDYDRFIKLLYLCNSNKSFNFREDIVKQNIDAFDFDRGETIVSIGAWVAMSNHFHLLLMISPRGCLGQEGITVFMGKLCTAYSMYFNKKYKRTGKLFEGVFKSTHIESDEQLKYNFSYIHLNPVKIIDSLWKEKGIRNHKKVLEFLNKYNFSSYDDYRGKKRSENKIISQGDFPDYFFTPDIFDEEILEWLNFTEK